MKHHRLKHQSRQSKCPKARDTNLRAKESTHGQQLGFVSVRLAKAIEMELVVYVYIICMYVCIYIYICVYIYIYACSYLCIVFTWWRQSDCCRFQISLFLLKQVLSIRSMSQLSVLRGRSSCRRRIMFGTSCCELPPNNR